MMLASWHYGVAEGFYGRVFGQIRSGRVALILLMPTTLPNLGRSATQEFAAFERLRE
ncbi:hypothetical protein MKK65_29370 [Methylobacterium sp. J-001]|uniref:hypothetical protein n=1 Tax=Methylobacterium sp. J-001 TaxID=2836609 RepID=UPI001FBB1439|nr:hypothetical protein [Methylobacterium sp. J-001]MCJ2120622.1 hypothetical protein [Methylobacterium sp. J-001]